MKSIQSIVLVLVTAFCLAAPGLATAEPVSDLKAELAGAGARKWVYVRIEKSMGPKKSACKAGQYWQFDAGSTLRISTCLAGQWEVRKLKYALKPTGPIDVDMTIVGKDLPFAGPRRVRVTQNAEKLIIRNPAPGKHVDQLDLIFSRSGD